MMTPVTSSRGHRGQVAEHHERLVKCGVDVVVTLPALVHRRVGAHDVVVGEDVREAQFLDALPIRAYGCGVSTKLGLREYHTNAHSQFNRAVPRNLPRNRR